MGKEAKKIRKEAREIRKAYASNFDDGKEMFCQFLEQLDRQGRRILIKAIKKGTVRDLLQGANNG